MIKAQRLLHHSTLGVRAIKKSRRILSRPGPGRRLFAPARVEALYRYVQWFRGGLVFKAHGLVYHSTLGPRVIKKKQSNTVSHSQGFVTVRNRVSVKSNNATEVIGVEG